MPPTMGAKGLVRAHRLNVKRHAAMDDPRRRFPSALGDFAHVASVETETLE